MKRIISLSAVVFVLGACAGNPPTDPVAAGEGRTLAETSSNSERPKDKHEQTPEAKAATQGSDPQPVARSRSVDPREDEFEIALGEWAVSPEADAIRPGEVTFLIHNRGTVPHGFEIELEGESSGSGSGDLFKAESELLQPGESTEMTVTLTLEGVYKIECLVDGHDDMGMEGPLEVRSDAPLVKEEAPAGSASPQGEDAAVGITDFAFDPSRIEVQSGTKVTWSNGDPAPHTVTSLSEEFDSDMLDEGESFSFTFEEPGTYDYRCNVHPDMKGTVKVL